MKITLIKNNPKPHSKHTSKSFDDKRSKQDLSVCIVAYHNYDDIKEVIKTLEEYTDKSISKTIYIVDNSSNDLNKDVFIDYLNNYRDIEYIDNRCNLGFGKANNQVLDLINSRYHAIVNPDILFVEDAFKGIIDYLDQNNDVGMVIPDIRDEEGNRQLVYRNELNVFDVFNRFFLKNLFKHRAYKHTLQDKDYTKPFEVPFGQGSFLVIRTDLFKELNGFDDRFFMYCEDADLCKRVNQISKLMYYPNARVIHKWEKGSHKSKKLFKYHIQSMKYYFDKWGYKIF